VDSIYVSGSYAAGTAVLGLSDLDLVVFARGSGERIRARYETLSRFLPLFGRDELALYDRGDLPYHCRKDRYLKYRLASSAGAMRLLYGPPVSDDASISAEEANASHLGFQWAQLVKHLVLQRQPRFDLRFRHTCAKLDAKLGQGGAPAGSNPDAVAEATYAAGVRRMRLLGSGATRSRERRATAADAWRRPWLSHASSELLKNFVVELQSRYRDSIDALLIAPRQVFPLDEEDIGVFIVERTALPLADVRELNAILGPWRTGRQRLSLYLLSDHVALAVGRDDSHQHCLLTAAWDPLTFLELQQGHSLLFGELDTGGGSAFAAMWRKVAEARRRDAIADVRRFVHHPNMARLPATEFQIFFWQALQAHSALDEFGLPPRSSSELAGVFAADESLDWLHAMRREYLADLNGSASMTETFYQPALALLRHLYPEE
jgi:hypothetical protein